MDPDLDKERNNPNLFVELPETVSNRIWSYNVFPWLELLPWQIP